MSEAADINLSITSTEIGEPVMNVVESVADVNQRWTTRSVMTAAKHMGQSAIVAVEVTPINEAIRFGAFGAVEATSHNPLLSAATLGLSTLAVEGSAALSSASLLSTDASRKMFTKVNNRLQKVLDKRNMSIDSETSLVTKASVTFAGGSVVSMALEQLKDPSRTAEQNRRYGLIASAWLAGTLTVAGAMASEGIDVGLQHPQTAGEVLGVAGAYAASRWGFKRMRLARLERLAPKNWADSDKNFRYGVIEHEDKLAKAATLEQEVWDEKGFGNLQEEGYGPHIDNSRTFAAFNNKEECKGLTRIFRGKENLVPPFTEMPFYDESERKGIVAQATAGEIEEVGTAAVSPDARGKHVSDRLWRLAYRDAVERDVKAWGIIMEPERVEKMNRKYGFTFRQLGPTMDYQGGDCAAFIMDVKEVYDNIKRHHPILFYWFGKKALNPKS